MQASRSRSPFPWLVRARSASFHLTPFVVLILLLLRAPLASATVTSPTGVPHTVAEGAVFNGVVATFSSGDSVGSLSATVAWGDGVTDTGTVTSTGGGNFNVSDTHTYADEGIFGLTITITDSADSTTGVATANFTVTEADGLTPGGVVISPVEGAPFSGTVGTF